MSLGTNIHRLRTQHNMSQGDLADALGVSRQSISKWETDGAVPELDKLIKLSQIFSVTLDELVHGESPASTPVPEPSVTQVIHHGPSARVIAGIVLMSLSALCLVLFTLIGGFWAGLLLMSPFFICGIVCLVCKKHPVLYVFWTLVILVDLYLRYATGLSWSTTRLTLMWTPEMNYMRLFIAWMQLLAILAMMSATALAYRKEPLTLTGSARIRYILGWVGMIAISLSIHWGTALLHGSQILLSYISYSDAVRLVSHALDYARIFLFTYLLTASLRWWRTKKHAE